MRRIPPSRRKDNRVKMASCLSQMLYDSAYIQSYELSIFMYFQLPSVFADFHNCLFVAPTEVVHYAHRYICSLVLTSFESTGRNTLFST